MSLSAYTIETDDISISATATFGQVYQYRRYPRQTVLLKNDSGETITDVNCDMYC